MWNDVMSATIIRNLKGLRTVQLTIRVEPGGFRDWVEYNFLKPWRSWDGQDILARSIGNLRILPLEKVDAEVQFIEQGDLRTDLQELCTWEEDIRKYLLDPQGAQQYALGSQYAREMGQIRQKLRNCHKAHHTCCPHGSEAACDEHMINREAMRKQQAVSRGKKYKELQQCLSEHIDEQGQAQVNKRYQGPSSEELKLRYEELTVLELACG